MWPTPDAGCQLVIGVMLRKSATKLPVCVCMSLASCVSESSVRRLIGFRSLAC